MKGTQKRIFILLIASLLVICMIPSQVFADSNKNISSIEIPSIEKAPERNDLIRVSENDEDAALKASAKDGNSTLLTNGGTRSGETEVTNATEFNAVIADLNANGGSRTIKLMNDVEVLNQNP